MARIGHSSTRAAMIYQHATRERDQAIAAALDGLIDETRQRQGIDPTETDEQGNPVNGIGRVLGTMQDHKPETMNALATGLVP